MVYANICGIVMAIMVKEWCQQWWYNTSSGDITLVMMTNDRCDMVYDGIIV